MLIGLTKKKLSVVVPKKYEKIPVGRYYRDNARKGDKFVDLRLKDALSIFLNNHYERFLSSYNDNFGAINGNVLFGYIHREKMGLEFALDVLGNAEISKMLDLVKSGYEEIESALDDFSKYDISRRLMITTAGFARPQPSSVKNLISDVVVLGNVENIIEEYFVPREIVNRSMLYKF